MTRIAQNVIFIYSITHSDHLVGFIYEHNIQSKIMYLSDSPYKIKFYVTDKMAADLMHLSIN
jgi:predicted TIM-barrel fold metal-dependent hydrolase